MKETPSPERYIALAKKWMDGSITPEEAEEYALWYNTVGEDESVDIPAQFATNKEEHRQRLLQQINGRRVKVVPMRRRVWRVAAAAAVLFAVAISAYYFVGNRNNGQQSLAGTDKPSGPNDIQPGVNGSILRLGNGKEIILDTARDGALNLASNSAMANKEAGILTFTNPTTTAAVEYYTLTTPRARQQRMTLPDGTQLWLNAASSIRFPSAFTGGTRQVDITGEAYLEVAKDASKPFIVNVNDASIQVLGTHFNVMAYNNEEALKTTLLEGSVRFSKGKEHVLLKPGQQGSLQQNGSIQLSSDVDVQSVTAWKDGMQSFNSADIQTIMRQVERWYDVDITYSGTMPAITFSGEIPRTANLSEVLKLFKASNIHFEIDKTMKKMTVSP